MSRFDDERNEIMFEQFQYRQTLSPKFYDYDPDMTPPEYDDDSLDDYPSIEKEEEDYEGWYY